MATIHASRTPTITRDPRLDHPGSAPEPVAPSHTRWGLIVTGIVAVVLLVAGVVAGALIVGSQDAATSTASAAAPADLSAMLPGGSVYDSQVPSVVAPDLSASLPGGSVYDSQVPSVVAPDLSASLPGGSVYDSQVPSHAS